MRNLAHLLVLLCCLLWSAPAVACFGEPIRHELDLEQVGVDTSPPEEIPSIEIDVVRGRGPRATGGCGEWESGSTDDVGRVILYIEAPKDDATPADRIGYRVVFVDGKLPRNITLPTIEAWRATGLSEAGIGEVFFWWDDGSTDDQEPIDFTLDVIPLDLAGNEGPAYRVRIRDGGSGPGCALSGRAHGPWSLMTLLVVMLVLFRVAGVWAQPGVRRSVGGGSRLFHLP